MIDANFWQDKGKSQKIIKEKKLYEDLINSFNNSTTKLRDLDDLKQLAIEEKNLSIQNEVFENIKELRKLVKKNEIKCFLSKEADSLDYDCFEIIKTLRKSDRGEYEITNLLEKYMNLKRLNYGIIDGWWVDAGTPESVENLEKLI